MLNHTEGNMLFEDRWWKLRNTEAVLSHGISFFFETKQVSRPAIHVVISSPHTSGSRTLAWPPTFRSCHSKHTEDFLVFYRAKACGDREIEKALSFPPLKVSQMQRWSCLRPFSAVSLGAFAKPKDTNMIKELDRAQ